MLGKPKKKKKLYIWCILPAVTAANNGTSCVAHVSKKFLLLTLPEFLQFYPVLMVATKYFVINTETIRTVYTYSW